ncbi:MAG: DUF192 domain-containing protein [Acidimicrobiales bacterium]
MTPFRLRSALWAAAAVLVLGLVAFLVVGANSPADPTLVPELGETTPPPGVTATSVARQRVSGFGEIAFQLQTGSDTGSDPGIVGIQRCALLAETDAQLQRGLMGRRDLSGYDGMIFRFQEETTGSFFMRNVPVPLEIAWFDAAGRLVSTAGMAPCPDVEGCPTYAPNGPYRLALEVEAGGLRRLGIGEGIVVTPGGPCEAAGA